MSTYKHTIEFGQFASRHMKALKSAGFVVERQEGRWVYHELLAQESPFVEALVTAIRAIPLSALEREIQGLRQRLGIRKDGKCLVGVQKSYLLSRGGVKHRFEGDWHGRTGFVRRCLPRA